MWEIVICNKIIFSFQIMSNKTGLSYYVKTLGILAPDEIEIKALYPGQVRPFWCHLIVKIQYFFQIKENPISKMLISLSLKSHYFSGWRYDM